MKNRFSDSRHRENENQMNFKKEKTPSIEWWIVKKYNYKIHCFMKSETGSMTPLFRESGLK